MPRPPLPGDRARSAGPRHLGGAAAARPGGGRRGDPRGRARPRPGHSLVVGHSDGGAPAAVYATEHPAAAVVTVSAPMRLERFAQLLSSLGPQLAGDGPSPRRMPLAGG